MVYTTCKNGKLVGKCYIFLEPCSNKAGVAIALPSRHQPHRPWRRGYSCLWNTSGQPSQGSTYTPFGGVENIGLTIRSPQEDHSKMETATPMPHAFLEHPVQPVPYASTRLNRAQRSRGSPCHSKRTTRPHRPQTIDVGHAFYGQGFPSGYVNSLLLKMAIDWFLSNQNGDFPIAMLNYQRVL